MEYERHEGEALEAYAARLLEVIQQLKREQREEKEKEKEFKEDLKGDMKGDFMKEMKERDREESAGGLEDAEEFLARSSAEKQSPMVLELLKNLQKCLVYTDVRNSETNRKLWNAYAKNWERDADWVKRMSGHVAKASDELSFVGDEWSDSGSLADVLQDKLFKH